MTAEDFAFLPYGRHQIDDDDVAAVEAILRGDWLTTGPAVERFERTLAEHLEAPHVVACASGTAALHLAVMAANVGSDDAVIVPAITFVATANAARYVGARVIFADVDPTTGLMGLEQLEEALARARSVSVKAILPVHLNGQCESLSDLHRLAANCGATVIEDACHALGGSYRRGNGSSAPIGSCRDGGMAIFSFHPVKTITMGEGGAVSTSDDEIAERLRRLRNHGLTRNPTDFSNEDRAFGQGGEVNPWYYELFELGYNYRASDIHCALGTSQLRKLDRFVARRRELAARYDSLLAELEPIVQPVRRVSRCEPAWHLYGIQIDFATLGASRSTVMDTLRQRGVGTQVHYIPVPWQPYYQEDNRNIAYPGATTYYERQLSLPLFPAMSDADVDRVVEILADTLGARRVT